MKKPLDPAVQEKLNRIPDAIDGVPNTVPGSLSSAFNFKGRKSPESRKRSWRRSAGRRTYSLSPSWAAGPSSWRLWGR